MLTQVEMQLTVQGTVEDFNQARFKSSLGAYVNVSPADISLDVSAASVNVKATITFADASAAGSVVDTLQGLASNLTAFSAAVGVTVEDATDPAVSQVVTETPPSSLLAQLDVLPAHEAAQLAGPPQSLFESSGVELVCSQARPPAPCMLSTFKLECGKIAGPLLLSCPLRRWRLPMESSSLPCTSCSAAISAGCDSAAGACSPSSSTPGTSPPTVPPPPL